MENSVQRSWTLNPPCKWDCQVTIDYPPGRTTPAEILALSGKIPGCDGVAYGADAFTVAVTVMAQSATAALTRAAETVTESLELDTDALSGMSTKRRQMIASLTLSWLAAPSPWHRAGSR